MFNTFADVGTENIKDSDFALGVASFLVVALGGTFIGLIFGAVASFTTKYTKSTPILEPLVALSIAYLSYLTAEITSTSSILA